MIVLDNSILSRIVRWRHPHPETQRALTGLSAAGRLIIVPGIVAQEVLSGVPEGTQLDAVQARLSQFDLRLAALEHHHLAARIRTRCQRAGVTVSTPDALIAAHGIVEGAHVLTGDQDFMHMARCVPELRLLWVD